MKTLVYIIALSLTLISCGKNEDPKPAPTLYTINVEKDNDRPAYIQIGSDKTRCDLLSTVTYAIVEDGMHKSIKVSYDDSYEVAPIRVEIKKDKRIFGEISGVGHIYFTLFSDSYSTTSSSSTSSNTHLCGYPTLDGTPCKRVVSGAYGYCWQHK